MYSQDRRNDFESTGDIAEDIVRQTMRQYTQERKQFNRDVGIDNYSSSDDEDKPKKGAGSRRASKAAYLMIRFDVY